MEDFKKYLEMEDMATNEKSHEYILTVMSRYGEIKERGLRVIKVKDGISFKKQAARLLLTRPNDDFFRRLNKNKVSVDCRSKVQTIESTFSLHIETIAEEHRLDDRYIPFLDYERIFNELETYKNEKHYYNISLDRAALKAILLTDGWYSLIVPERHLKIDSMEMLSMYADFAIMVLKGYLDKFYAYEKDRWEDPHREYQLLKEDDSNFVNEYKLTYYDNDERDNNAETIERFVHDLQILINQHSGIPNYEKKEFDGTLTAFDFRAHLYTPLFSFESNSLKLTISPVSLNGDEAVFVNKLKIYVEDNVNLFDGKGLYLLRNKSKAGMGFFEAGNFYPDYIMWIDTPDVQYISFIDPKGLRHMQWTDPKIEFYSAIKELEEQLQSTSSDKRIVLNSFIMSGTSSADLSLWWDKSKQERHDKHVFCLDERDCIEGMMGKMLRS
jgi:hypothetical protein